MPVVLACGADGTPMVIDIDHASVKIAPPHLVPSLMLGEAETAPA